MTRLAAMLALSAAMLVDAASAAEITRGKLALMPLPKQSLGAGAALLPLDPDSGVVSNAKAADDSAPGVTAATYDRLGRITGYGLDYNDAAGKALAAGHGLLEVETGVELYRSPDAAHAGLGFHKRDDAKTAALKLSGVSIRLTPTTAPRVSDERYAYAVRAKIAGKPTIFGAEVVMRSGSLLAFVSVTAVDRATPGPLAARLARRLDARIAGVLAGTVKGPPVTLPGKLKAGPPPNGPELSALTLRPGDVKGARVTHQGYQLDKDLTPISEYAREFEGGGFLFVSEEVALFHSATEASFTLTLLEASLKSPEVIKAAGGTQGKQIRSFKPRSVSIRAGDESRGVIARVAMTNGLSFDEGFVVLRVGPTTQFVMIAAAHVKPTALVELAEKAAQRARAGLRKH
jgi:hypothetical protein